MTASHRVDAVQTAQHIYLITRQANRDLLVADILFPARHGLKNNFIRWEMTRPELNKDSRVYNGNCHISIFLWPLDPREKAMQFQYKF